MAKGLEEVGLHVGTAAFDLEHGGLLVATGKPEHEGHYQNGIWHTWPDNYRARPSQGVVPVDETELAGVVARAASLRVVGGGHSFNDDPLTSIGAIGTCGIVTEVELQLVEAFRLEKRTEMVDRAQAETSIESLIAGRDHLSFYCAAGGAKVETIRQHRWLHTQVQPTPHGERFVQFQQVRQAQDPKGRFLNAFTRRLLVP